MASYIQGNRIILIKTCYTQDNLVHFYLFIFNFFEVYFLSFVKTVRKKLFCNFLKVNLQINCTILR